MKCLDGRLFCLGVALLTLASCTETLEPLLTGQKVTLMAPVNHAVSADTTQTFAWDSVGSAVAYELQVVTPGFDSIVTVALDTLVRTNRFDIPLGPGTYQWRVQARNNSTVSAFSDPWTLTVQ
jgi:microcompartment protein CcmK/EutM